jgi:hypothetical protein
MPPPIPASYARLAPRSCSVRRTTWLRERDRFQHAQAVPRAIVFSDASIARIAGAKRLVLHNPIARPAPVSHDPRPTFAFSPRRFAGSLANTPIRQPRRLARVETSPPAREAR